MDFWDQDYFRVVKITTCLVGQWPYQTLTELIFFRSVLFVLVVMHLIPRIRALVLYSDNPEIVLSVSSFLVIDTIFVCKILLHSYNLTKVSQPSSPSIFNTDIACLFQMKYLLGKLHDNWSIFSEDELQVLHQWSAAGKKISFIYLGTVLGSCGIWITRPLQLRLGQVFTKANETIRVFPVPVDYGSINVDKYYWSISLLTEFTSLLIGLGVVACDLLFFMYSYHAFGLFATLGYQIEHLPIDSDSGLNEEMHVKRCVKLHYRIIEFAEEIDELYRWIFFTVIGFNMILISMTGVELAVNLTSVQDAVAYISLITSPFGHLFVECLMGQRLIDSSLGVQEYIYNAQWYASSIKSQKMIGLLLMRSQLPCQLTAGKFLVMNFATFNAF
ncbi:odorant receptor 63a-like isoform X2 [Diachasmimorpha longicaudata]|uniref:odorant receptor 63a-like isoform X2 n=1 Tax=Diachasmimorpha longicaudata TaxID=58733 RepID=UPI0030B8E48A